MSDYRVVVYSRPGCHLCDEACQMLEQYGLQPEKVNIETDAGLRERYGEVIPVVTFNGEERFRGRVDEVLLRRLLRAR